MFHNRRQLISAARRPFVGTAVYQGPGDIVGSAMGFWGLRAYTSASIGSNVIQLHRSSDDAVLTFTSQAGGGLDTAAIATWRDAAGAASLTVDILYDQSGNARHLDHYSFANQGHANNQPTLLLTGGPTNHAVRINGFDGTHLLAINGFAALPTTSQPVTGIYYAKRTGNFTGFNFVFGDGGPQFGFRDAANTATVYAGNFADASATDNAWHAIVTVPNGSSTIINVDGTDTTGLDAGTAGFGPANFQVGTRSGNNFTGDLTEFGCWASGFSGPNRTATSANMILYWGT